MVKLTEQDRIDRRRAKAEIQARKRREARELALIKASGKRELARAKKEEAKSKKEQTKERRQEALFKRQDKIKAQSRERSKQLASARKRKQFLSKADKFSKNLASAFGGGQVSARQPTPQQIMRHREKMARLQIKRQQAEALANSQDPRFRQDPEEDHFLNSGFEDVMQPQQESYFPDNNSPRRSRFGFGNFLRGRSFGFSTANGTSPSQYRPRSMLQTLGEQRVQMWGRPMAQQRNILSAPNTINNPQMESTGRLMRSEPMIRENIWLESNGRAGKFKWKA